MASAIPPLDATTAGRGTPLAVTSPNQMGAYPERASESSIRVVRYKFESALDSPAEITTKFMTRAPDAGHGTTPVHRTRPPPMNAPIPNTLTRANQYSRPANQPTCAMLMARRSAEVAITQSHCGTPGNQNPK